MFIPATPEEVRDRGWSGLDIILVTGDTYIDSSSIGVSITGHVLMDAGFRVGIIAQPDINSDRDILRLGEPELFWGVTSGSVDSMVSNYNADRSRRRQDDLTPGGVNTSRPDRACIAYTGLIRHWSKNRPVVLGGIEASLRRTVHYDYWQNRIRRSVLFDAKADILVYGMGELTMIALAQNMAAGMDWKNIPGLCYISDEPPADSLMLHSFEECAAYPSAFAESFRIFYENADSVKGKTLVQKHGDRWLVQNPPSRDLTSEELDHVYELPYERDVHPYYGKAGEVRALDTIRFSITTHRGCFGGCRFCSIAVHQGKHVISRSPESVLREAENMTHHPLFRGTITDAGGPTGNMYGMGCETMKKKGACSDRKCLGGRVCRSIKPDHVPLTSLLKKLRQIPGVKHVFAASGIRYDLVMADERHGREYIRELAGHHISGMLRIAPEHLSPRVLELMGKPDGTVLDAFRKLFEDEVKKSGRKSALAYYIMAAHPGCTLSDMNEAKKIFRENTGFVPASVQIFTPTPSTWSTLMYYTETDPFTGKKLFVEKDMGQKTRQKRAVSETDRYSRPKTGTSAHNRRHQKS